MRNIFDYILNLVSIFAIVVKRLRYHLGLSASSAVGIISVLSLVICVPVFTNAVMSLVLKQELSEKAALNHRALFSMHAYYRDDTTYSSLSLKNASYVAQWINEQLSGAMGLKVDAVFVELSTEPFSWEPVKYQSSQPPFADIGMNIMGSDLVPAKTRLVEGVWPTVPTSAPGSAPLPVAVLEDYADANFLNVGDVLRSRAMEVEIAGIFRAIDPSDLSWFYSPETTFNKTFWVPLEAFQTYLPSIIERPATYTSWYAMVNDQSLRFTNSMNYSRSITRLSAGLHGLLNASKIDYSPADRLQAYEDRLNSLITLFYVAGAPLVLLALIFISLTASIAVQQEEQEIATMRGRGVSWAHVYALNLAESLVLVTLAIPFSLLLGWLLSVLMGKTQLFLQFTRQADLTFSLRDINLGWVGLFCLLVFASRLLPLLGLRRTTTVIIKQEKSRSLKKPLWERFFLDFILMVPALYVYWLLRSQAKPVKVLTDLKVSGSQGQYDPLMFLASSLFAVSACMIVLRFFPLLMRLLAAISDRVSRAGPYLAIQEIYRRAREHVSVMLLIMISLSLAIFSSSMATTLDQWMHDSQYYQAGSDLVVKEYAIPLNASMSPGGGAPPPPVAANPLQGVESLISLEKHLTIPGIQSATYVGNYTARCTYGSQISECVLMGIDRLSFPITAFYRHDFSTQPLGALMNALAANPNGVLVPQSLLDSTGLRLGDRMFVTSEAGTLGAGFSQEMQIVGVYRYFPTIYPRNTPILVANMATLFGSQEAATGYDVWIDLKDKSSSQAVLEQLKGLALKDQLLVDVRSDVPLAIQKLLDQPEWVGLFGILSVGFLLTGLMACIGFVLESFASLRKHYNQFGILQAIGLSTRQLVSYLVLERLLLMVITLACGTGIGYITSVMFVPLLQISAAPGIPVPPFEVVVGWSQSIGLIVTFGLVLLAAILATIGYLMQIKIFQAVKMGESI